MLPAALPAPSTTTTASTSSTSSSKSATAPVSSAPAPSTSLDTAEIKRKAEAGIPLTNPTPEAMALYQQYQAAAAKSQPATTSTATPASASSASLPPGYVTSQQQRYVEAVKAGDQDLIQRLQADAARVGYTLPSVDSAKEQYFQTNYGGTDAYVAGQVARYTEAASKGDTDLMRRIEEDARRVGYTLPNVQQQQPALQPLPTNQLIGAGAGPQPVMTSPTNAQPTGYVPTYTGPNFDEMRAQLEQLFASRQASELAALRAALETALAGYAAQERQAQQLAYNQRNAADVVAAQDQAALRELLANLGMTGDGQNLTAQAAQAASRLQAIGAINQQEADALMRIAEQRSALQNSAAQQEQALIQAIGADKAAALLDLLQYGDTRAFEMEQLNYGRYRDAIEDQFRRDALDWQRQMDLAALLGVYNGQPTLAGRSAALAERQANLDAALAVGAVTGRLVSPQADWSGLFRQAADPSTPLNLTGQRYQLDYDQLMAALTGRLPDGSLTVSEQQRQFDNEMAMRQLESLLAQRRFDNDLALRKFEEDVRRFGLQYALDQARLEADRSAPQVTQSALNQIIDNINAMYTQYNPQTGMRTVTNPQAVRTYILALNLSDDLTDQLLTYYGLPTR